MSLRGGTLEYKEAPRPAPLVANLSFKATSRHVKHDQFRRHPPAFSLGAHEESEAGCRSKTAPKPIHRHKTSMS